MEIVTIEKLLEQLRNSGRSYNMDKIQRAYDLSEKAHRGQMRISGEPYITHPLAVAYILMSLGMDTDTIIAAILHDVVEDTDTPLRDIETQFGRDVALLVDGVTKLRKMSFSTREEQQAENVRKMLLAMNEDIRVIIIKLADRLHNMRTLDVRREQKQRDQAKETMDVYAPIAHRLGIRPVKEELEDLSLHYLDAPAYVEIEELLQKKQHERIGFLDAIKAKIQARIEREHLKADIQARVKSVFGIYRKMYMQGRDFEEIYDIYAIRIIVDSVAECYTALGLMHDMFTPIPNRFKDYISTPKPNMYQSLHTTVVDKEATPFEIQIRTWDMHHTAEYGIAAHWKYKAGIQGKSKLEERVAWVRQLLESQDEDIEDIVGTIKSDLGPEEVFVFTPKGDVKILPSGSTIIDFAYAIHSEVGNRLMGAKVNGRMMSIDHEVQTGEIIEILTGNGQGHGPSRDWIKLAKTSEARSKIRSWFKKERREENIHEGRAELEREFKRYLIELDDQQHEEFLADLAKRQHCATVDDLYASIGYGGIQLSKIMPRIKDDYLRKFKKDGQKEALQTKAPTRKVSSGVIVEDEDDILVKFAQCCNPVPGDEIIGFITRGYGVSIHKRDCINVTSSLAKGEQNERWVAAHWAENLKETFKVIIELVIQDRPGLLADVSIQLANMHLPLHELNARELRDKNAGITLTVSISDLDQLQNIMSNLGKIPGVLSVKRTGK